MRSFRKYIVEFKKENPSEKETKQDDQEDQAVEDPEPSSEDSGIDSEIGEWVKKGSDWIVHVAVDGEKYDIAFSPLDESELHWKFTYHKHGQKDSADIKKFGSSDQWIGIWTTIINVLKDFIRIFHPHTVKFIGMSASKRPESYRDIFKIYVENFRYAFKKSGYFTTFDIADFNMAPSFVIKKGSKKEPEKKKKE